MTDPLKTGAVLGLLSHAVSCAILIFYKNVFLWLNMKNQSAAYRIFHIYVVSGNVAYCFPGRSICCVFLFVHTQWNRSRWSAELVQMRQRWRETEDVTTLSYPCCSLLLVQTERAFTHTYAPTLEPRSPGRSVLPCNTLIIEDMDAGYLNNMPYCSHNTGVVCEANSIWELTLTIKGNI